MWGNIHINDIPFRTPAQWPSVALWCCWVFPTAVFAGRGFLGLGDCVCMDFIFLLHQPKKRGNPHCSPHPGRNSCPAGAHGRGIFNPAYLQARVQVPRWSFLYFTSGIWSNQKTSRVRAGPARSANRAPLAPAGGAVGSAKTLPRRRSDKPNQTSQKRGPRVGAVGREMGVCSGSLPCSATHLGYGLGKLVVMRIALLAQKLPLLASKFASDSRDMGASFRASLGSFSRDTCRDLTVGAGLEAHGDVGMLGQKWSCEEPGEACEGLSLLESRREGTEAHCCFWLHRQGRKGGCQGGNHYSKQRKSTDWPAGRYRSLLQWVQVTKYPQNPSTFVTENKFRNIGQKRLWWPSHLTCITSTKGSSWVCSCLN